MTNLTNRKILITGGLGFVGSNLALRLLKEGANITLSDINTKNKYRLSPNEEEFIIKECDITNFNQVNELIDDYDFVFHLAAQTSHTYSMKNPRIDTDINVKGVLNVLEAMKENIPDARLIYTSTKGVAGIPPSLPVTEETPTDPLDVYSANKLLAENYCKIYNHHYNLDFSILRLTNIFGPRQQISSPSLGILNFFIGQAMKDETITIYGKGNQLRDYNYVENAIDALLLCATKEEAKNETFYLGSNIGTKFKDMASTIVEVVGKGTIKFVPYPTAAKKIEIGDFIVDYTKLRKSLGWEPKISFKQGIEKSINFYKSHPEYF